MLAQSAKAVEMSFISLMNATFTDFTDVINYWIGAKTHLFCPLWQAFPSFTFYYKMKYKGRHAARRNFRIG